MLLEAQLEKQAESALYDQEMTQVCHLFIVYVGCMSRYQL